MPRFEMKRTDLSVLLPEEAHPYGKANKPSTPVGDVISNYYGQKAEAMIISKYGYLDKSKKPLGLDYSRGHTRASAMCHNAISQS